MKNKILFITMILVGIFYFNPYSVKANTQNLTYRIPTNFTDYEDFYSAFSDSHFLELYNLMKNYYNTNYYEDYPYYILSFSTYKDNYNNDLYYYLTLTAYTQTISFVKTSNGFRDSWFLNNYNNNNCPYCITLYASYQFNTSTYTLPYRTDTSGNADYLHSSYLFVGNYLNDGYALESNFDIIINTSGTDLVINNFRDTETSLTLHNGDTYPTLFRDTIPLANFSEVQLNNYDYVILYLKDYNTSAFSVPFYVKGSQVCITTVDDFGTTERETMTDICTLDYEDYSLVSYYFNESDLTNNSVLYISVYNNTIDTYLKYNHDLFDIVYGVNGTTPIITYNGTTYNAIKFEDLTITANLNEQEGFVPGAVVPIIDYFSSFTTDTFGLTRIITAPLSFINSITTSTCSPLSLNLPILNQTLTLPCMTTIYTNYFGSIFTLYQSITLGIISYFIVLDIFRLIKNFKDPNNDKIEVVDL